MGRSGDRIPRKIITVVGYFNREIIEAVSYTHLDVYKRQVVVLERLLQPLDERTLAGTRSAGNADDRNVHDKIVY